MDPLGGQEGEKTLEVGSGMNYRSFGSTGWQVSEVGFGSWGIGGEAYGPVGRTEALGVLARAEEMGCNLVDTAEVYGESESILGEFLQGRRDRWFLATKYSGQSPGMRATAEDQLRRLKTDFIDFYQLHWAPRGAEESLYDELIRLKERGLARAVGVSVYSVEDIDAVLTRPEMDGIQVPFSLLEPEPFLSRSTRVSEAGLGILVRSSLKGGLLSGRYGKGTTFHGAADRRSRIHRKELAMDLKRVEHFRFLEKEEESLAVAAMRFPLSFPSVSSVLLGTRTLDQAEVNFGEVPGGSLSRQSLESIHATQDRLGLGREPMGQRLRSLAGTVVKRTLRSIRKAQR